MKREKSLTSRLFLSAQITHQEEVEEVEGRRRRKIANSTKKGFRCERFTIAKKQIDAVKIKKKRSSEGKFTTLED